MHKILSFILFFSLSFAQAQELNCIVKVNAEQLAVSNNQVFKTLEKSLTDFINKTNWTSQAYKQNEKINCSILYFIQSQSSYNLYYLLLLEFFFGEMKKWLCLNISSLFLG